jgi:hypothetical protein
VGSKPIVVVLAAVLAGLFWIFLKETYLAVAVEAATERAAEFLGMSRPGMISAATPYVLSIGAASAVAWAAYSLGSRDRSRTPDFDIEFEPADPRFVDITTSELLILLGYAIFRTAQFCILRSVPVIANSQIKFSKRTTDGALL